jgi:hypothetical protein
LAGLRPPPGWQPPGRRMQWQRPIRATFRHHTQLVARAKPARERPTRIASAAPAQPAWAKRCAPSPAAHSKHRPHRPPQTRCSLGASMRALAAPTHRRRCHRRCHRRPRRHRSRSHPAAASRTRPGRRLRASARAATARGTPKFARLRGRRRGRCSPGEWRDGGEPVECAPLPTSFSPLSPALFGLLAPPLSPAVFLTCEIKAWLLTLMSAA